MLQITQYPSSPQIFYKNGYLLLLAPTGTVVVNTQSPALGSLWNASTGLWDTCCKDAQQCAEFKAIQMLNKCHRCHSSVSSNDSAWMHTMSYCSSWMCLASRRSLS